MGLGLQKLEATFAVDMKREVERFVTGLFESHQGPSLGFHDLSRAKELVRDAMEVAVTLQLNIVESERLYLAAWLLLTGYCGGYPAIKEKSLSQAKNFLVNNGYSDEGIQVILDCMRSAQDPAGEKQVPKSVGGEILSDVSILYFAKKKFWRRIDFLRQEMEQQLGHELTDYDWLKLIEDRMSSARFYTSEIQNNYGKQLEKNLREVRREIENKEECNEDEGKRKKILKGTETLFRTQSRTLTNLVAMADKKAHMIITVNAITISIFTHSVAKEIWNHSLMAIPSVGVIAVNFATIVFAVMAIRPRMPVQTHVTHEDVVLKNGQLLTQVVFSDISLQDFRHGIKQLMYREEDLYDAMIQSLYGTARVLKQKFWFLHWSYTIFIWGMLGSAALGLVSILIQKTT